MAPTPRSAICQLITLLNSALGAYAIMGLPVVVMRPAPSSRDYLLHAPVNGTSSLGQVGTSSEGSSQVPGRSNAAGTTILPQGSDHAAQLPGVFMAMNEWLVAAEKALEDALGDPVRTDHLLRVAQVHALIAIGQEIAGIRELIIVGEPVEMQDDVDERLREDC